MAIKKTIKKTVRKKKPSAVKISKKRGLKDSDADGIPDHLEKKIGTNPRKADSDKDGLNDLEELVYGTDPLDSDTDKDGMKDGMEVRKGRNPRGKGLLKDFFIPNLDNNYLPHALRTKRLVLYTTTALIVKLVIVATVLAFPLAAILSPDVLTAESRKIVTLTNQIRVEQKVKALKQNALLDQAAFKKAEDMILNQYFSHISPQGKRLSDWLDISGIKYKAAGENLALGFSSAEEVVNAWAKSKTHYSNIVDPDFNEVGVSMVSGNYQQYDTTLVAQFFAKIETIKVAAVEPQKSPEIFSEPVTPLEPFPAAQNSVKSEKMALEAPLLEEPLIVEQEPLEKLSLIDVQKTRIMVSDTPNQKVVSVEAYLDPSVVEAEVMFSSYHIELSLEGDVWKGRKLIFNQDSEQIFSPVTLANLTATDNSGKQETKDIEWENIVPIKPSLASQYFFVKSHPSNMIKPLFSFGLTFYQILLALTIIALILNVFIEIKRQNPKTIVFSLAFIFLLGVLIVI